MSTSPAVTYERRGNVGVILVKNPPVNALAAAVRQGLADCLAQGNADAGVTAMVLAGDGRTFIAGADIREFGKPPSGPGLNDVNASYETNKKPVIAAIHGTALGGGLEVALSCASRVAIASRQGRPARNQSRPVARRRRHAAPAARRRPGRRAGNGHLGPARLGQGSARASASSTRSSMATTSPR